MPQRAKTSDKDLVNELIARQDEVIGELDKLEASILEAIESLGTARREEQASEGSALTADPAETLKMPQRQSPPTDADRSSRAA